MKKIILVPTDFTIGSLYGLKHFLSAKDDPFLCKILLLHGVHLSDSIPELLFFSKETLLERLTNPEFEQACATLKQEHAARIDSIHADIFTGFSQSAFNLYAEAHNIDEAFIPENHIPRIAYKRSFDVVPFIRKSPLKVNQPALEPGNTLFESQTPTGVFS